MKKSLFIALAALCVTTSAFATESSPTPNKTTLKTNRAALCGTPEGKLAHKKECAQTAGTQSFRH